MEAVSIFKVRFNRRNWYKRILPEGCASLYVQISTSHLEFCSAAGKNITFIYKPQIKKGERNLPKNIPYSSAGNRFKIVPYWRGAADASERQRRYDGKKRWKHRVLSYVSSGSRPLLKPIYESISATQNKWLRLIFSVLTFPRKELRHGNSQPITDSFNRIHG